MERGLLPNWLPMLAVRQGSLVKAVVAGRRYVLADLSPESLEKLYASEIEYFYVPRSPKHAKLPRTITTSLAYLVGYHLGDGYLEDIDKTIRRKGRPDYEIGYSDRSREMLRLVLMPIFQRLFGVSLHVSKKKGENMYVARLYSKIVYIFLHAVLGLPKGKKSAKSISSYVQHDEKLLQYFLRGFFDAEGYAYFDTWNRKPRLGITSSNKALLYEIRALLRKCFHIPMMGPYKKYRQDCWELKLFEEGAIREFVTKIGSSHPEKKKKLESLCSPPEGAT